MASPNEKLFELMTVSKNIDRICDFEPFRDRLRRLKIIVSLYTGKLMVFDINS